MKTTLPPAINTVAEAKLFLDALRNNNELFHPEDDATDISWALPEDQQPTPQEAQQLNKLMEDIYNLDGNNGNHRNPKFDPCEYIMLLDMELKDISLKSDFMKGLFDQYGQEISYCIESEPDDGRRGPHFSLSFIAKGDLIGTYIYYSKEEAEDDVNTLNNKTSIEFNEG